MIAVGVGLTDLPITLPVIAVALLGLVVPVCLRWTYFDVLAPVAEGVLHRQTGAERIRLARDSHTYLHFPMVAGIRLEQPSGTLTLNELALVSTRHLALRGWLPG